MSRTYTYAAAAVLFLALSVSAQFESEPPFEPNPPPTTRPVPAPPMSPPLTTTETVNYTLPKDPRLAAILSFGMPGFGQIYAERTLKGIGFMVGEAIAFGTVAAILSQDRFIDVAAADGNTYRVMRSPRGEDVWDELTDGERAAVIIGGLTGVTLHVWNVFDAFFSAEDYNLDRGIRVVMLPGPQGGGIFLAADF